MRIVQAVFPGIPPMDYATYEKGVNAIALPETNVLSEIINDRFTLDEINGHEMVLFR